MTIAEVKEIKRDLALEEYKRNVNDLFSRYQDRNGIGIIKPTANIDAAWAGYYAPRDAE